ncbi:hypothetical protein DFR70_10433 [Nocardia tenerifensis]|uniref:Uncharacterized protein n=2 Tax=Nocardia tenerifensis TaxID=228006 RepID=A0A318K5J7_9NOCA|nr:hypothetical protein [Nocardia tenerifensis]PXX64972.1 hypothetical protein DFR70_10433 [Nocardia tenerifensis]
MPDRRTSDDIYAVPEADLAEQSIPAYPSEPGYIDDGPDEGDAIDPEIAETVSRDAWDADPADVLDQSIPIPFDDEPDLI